MVLTIDYKPTGADDDQYKLCYKGKIVSAEWTSGKANIETDKSEVVLRFSFDCGQANNTAFGGVEIANLELLKRKSIGGKRIRME